MKRLFAIRNAQTNNIVKDVFFQEKLAAKHARDDLNQPLDAPIFVVTLGPDHWKFKKNQQSHPGTAFTKEY